MSHNEQRAAAIAMWVVAGSVGSLVAGVVWVIVKVIG